MIKRKRELFTNRAIKTFYFLDEQQVQSLHAQISEEPELKRVEKRRKKGTTKSIRGKLPLVEPGFEVNNQQETTEYYEKGSTPEKMYNEVERYLLINEEIIFGMEEFDFDKTSIEDFESMCEQMKDRFEFEIPGNFQEEYISSKIKEYALAHVEEISNCSGYIAILSEFSVKSRSDGVRILSIFHPLNDYLSEGDVRVEINITCTEENINPSAIHAMKNGKSFKGTCLGKVVNYNPGKGIWEINPIAVY